MGNASKWNKQKNVNWEIDTDEFKYIKPSDLKEGREYKLYGLYVSKDNGFGQGAVAILEDCFLNMPARMLDVVKEMVADPDTVVQIKAGEMNIRVESFFSEKYKRKGYDVIFIDKD